MTTANAAEAETAPANPLAKAARIPGPPPASIVAMRFPSHWQSAPPPARTDAPQELAYAPESAPQAAGGYQLSSVDPAPIPRKRVAKPVPRDTTLFNDAQLASIKKRLRLTPQQERYWPQVEQALRAISWKLARQQNSRRPVRGDQAVMIDPNSPEVARLKTVAFPLIMNLREDQKQEVRQLAHTMGLSKVAAMF